MISKECSVWIKGVRRQYHTYT